MPCQNDQQALAPKKNTKWLSEPAREAKRRRRRLEKKWKRTKLETDRIDYRTACREAGTLINESRRKFISDEINNCSTSKQRWSKINNILHPKNGLLVTTIIQIDKSKCDRRFVNIANISAHSELCSQFEFVSQCHRHCCE